MVDLAPYGEAIAKASEFATTAIKRIFPEKISELDSAKLQQEITLQLMQNDFAGLLKEYEDRGSARALAQADVAKGNWFSTVLAATVRPFFGYVVMGAFVFSFAAPYIPGAPVISIDGIQKEIMLSVIYFFFGGRTIEKGLALWKGGNGK